MWKQNHRVKSDVLRNHSDWLSYKEAVPLSLETQSLPPEKEEAKASKRGRPTADFSACSKRTKQRRIAKLAETDKSAADTLREVHLESNPLFQEVNVTEVLSVIIDTNLTKHQYLTIRDFINSKLSYNVLPSYKKVLSEKKKSYPDAESVTVSESQAEVELQSLLDHTASRILDLQTEVLNVITDVNISNLVLIGKWGFDGSTGYSDYKQRVSNDSLQDNSLFVTSYVPLQLVTKSSTPQDAKVIWKNPRPSSTRYCRPIRFNFKKETTEVCIEERNYLTKKIDML